MYGSRNWKGTGAQSNATSRFSSTQYVDEGGDLSEDEEKTGAVYKEVEAKSIVNEVESPDVGLVYSLNAYQGCLHGCVYCYARSTHPYWGFSAGMDFERIIMVKRNAVELLAKTLNKKAYVPKVISFSGNTDCYQPIERKYELTRNCLKLMLEYHHPCAIITKNALVCRDLDILSALAKHNLIRVYFSLSTLNEDLRRALEPKTSTIGKRLEAISALSEAGIPVGIVYGPVIPGLNHHEILSVAKATAQAGARSFSYTVLRLNGETQDLFKQWLDHYFPDRKDKVLNQVASLHGNSLSDTNFGRRMKGEGTLAKIIADQFALARKLYFHEAKIPEWNFGAFTPKSGKQTQLIF